MDIEKRVVVISGASGVLGTTTARALAARGANLVLLGRDPARLKELADGLSLPAGRLLTQTVDLLTPAEAESAAAAVVDRFGRVDALLHLVGGWTGGKSLIEAHAGDLASMLDQHVWTTFNLIQALVPHLIRNGWGRIVMISSPTARCPAAGSGPYAAGKAAQEALLLALSQEIKDTGVTANLLLVRTIDTRRAKVDHPSAENAGWTTPEELIAGIFYLLSSEAGAINGARIPMFGSH